MAVTDYDFFSTRTDIIGSALRKVGAIGTGDPIPAEYHADAVLALNQIVKNWQNDHVFLWSVTGELLTLIAGTKSYALTTPTIWIDRAWLRDSTGKDVRELEVCAFADYQNITDKDSPGQPSLLVLDSQPTPSAYLWPVPNNANEKIYYLSINRLKDWEDSSSNADFNPRWDLALIYALAAELAPEHGLSVGEQSKLETRALREFTKAKSGGREKVTRTHVRGAFSRRG